MPEHAYARTASATTMPQTAHPMGQARPSADRRLWLSLFTAACILAAIAIAGGVVYLSSRSQAPTVAAASPSPSPTTVTRTTRNPTASSVAPAVVDQTTPTEVPVTATVPSVPEPHEGQPCGPAQFNEHSADGTLYCSAMNGAWTDLTNQSRPAVAQGSPCTEPGARARVARTDGIATCTTGPDGTLAWNW